MREISDSGICERGMSYMRDEERNELYERWMRHRYLLNEAIVKLLFVITIFIICVIHVQISLYPVLHVGVITILVTIS